MNAQTIPLNTTQLSYSRCIAAYFLIMAIPESVLALIFYGSLIYLYSLPTLDSSDPDAQSITQAAAVNLVSIALLLSVTAGFFFLPGYWKMWRIGTISRNLWILSLAYNLLWALIPFLFLHGLVPHIFDLPPRLGETLIITLSFAPALLGSALSAYCLYTSKFHAHSPN